MKWVLRVLPLALAGLVRAAEPAPLVPVREALPAILVTPPTRALIDPLTALEKTPRASSAPISDRTRALLHERGLAVVKAAQGGEKPAQPAAPSTLADPDLVTMERFVVTAEKDARFKPPPPPDSPLLEIVKTGRFFTSKDGSKTGDFKFLKPDHPWNPQSADFTRFEIGFSIRF